MDLRTQTSLIAAMLSFALVASVLLRPRKRRVHFLFGLFAVNVGLWHLSTSLVGVLGDGGTWQRINLGCAVLLPLAAVQFFRAFVSDDNRRMILLNRAAIASALVILIAVFTPIASHIVVATAMVIYIVVFLFASLAMLYRRSRAVASRFESARIQFLALVGFLAALFTLVDYLPYVGLDIPPVGTVLTLIFLYVLSQSIVRHRMLDLYELAGRLAVLTALSFALAAVLWVLGYFTGDRYFLHAVVAAMVVLLVFEPLRSKVEQKISLWFFRERYDFEASVVDLRQRIAHVLELDELTQVLLQGLERSRRVTHAAVYLVDEEQHGYNLVGHHGPKPVARIEAAPARPLLDRLQRDGSLVHETVTRELSERREGSDDRDAETLFEILQTMDAMNAGLCLSISAERGNLYGLLCLRDERVNDAYSPEEVQLVRGLAAQAAIAVENSRLYENMKVRDRLALLGEMSAGLAHEIRNPLGAIKASAQYLADESDPSRPEHEFLDIIVDEVDRLDRVVSSFLDYARPTPGNPTPTDVNAIVGRTMQLMNPECSAANVTPVLVLAEDLPAARVDAERLRQVILNLVKNALQAMETGGELRVETSFRDLPTRGAGVRSWVELRVSDTGPGIPQRVLKNLFVPFVTTKDRGTGLGLAISQRIVNAAGGAIEVRTQPNEGTTFVVRLPIAEERGTPLPAGATGLPHRRSPSMSSMRAPDSSELASSPAASPSSSASTPGDTASVVTTKR